MAIFSLHRRGLFGGALALLTAALLPRKAFAATVDTSGLAPMTGDVVPIGPAERSQRLERAQRLMRDNGLSAILIEPGSSLVYFTGVSWWRSERLTAAVIPVKGDPIIVTPYFEEPSIRQSLAVPADVRVWQEDENPLALIAAALRESGRATGAIGI
jgi:Xaa-Pro dipeptidase